MFHFIYFGLKTVSQLFDALLGTEEAKRTHNDNGPFQISSTLAALTLTLENLQEFIELRACSVQLLYGMPEMFRFRIHIFVYEELICIIRR